MTDDDSVFAVYNRALMALAAEAEDPRHLPAADASAKAVSPVCGSEVTLEFSLSDGRISALGWQAEACALTKSVIAVMNKAAPGKTPADVLKAGRDLAAMLDGGPAPDGDWEPLKVLLPVRDYKARHNSVLLPFEAAEKAFKNKSK